MKIALLGAAGGIGQPLALLLKLQLPAQSALSLYDISPLAIGIATDLSHIPTAVDVSGSQQLQATLENADIVVIAAGLARKPGMDRAALFDANAQIMTDLSAAVAQEAPQALIAIITNPVNSLVPLAAKVLQRAGVYDKRKLFGVTTLDVLRAKTFVAQLKHSDPAKIEIPVIGGHSATTILPLFSQTQAEQPLSFSNEEVQNLTEKVQQAGSVVVEAKSGSGSATLSMAQAAAQFTLELVAAQQGSAVISCSFVANDEAEPTLPPFFARQIKIGKAGIESYIPIGELSTIEQQQFAQLLATLDQEILLGENFIAKIAACR